MKKQTPKKNIRKTGKANQGTQSVKNEKINNQYRRLVQIIKEGSFFVFVALASLAFLSLYSWSLTDPAWSHSQTQTTLKVVKNMGGVIGAYFADISYYLFGYLAFLLPVLFVLIGWLIFLGCRQCLSALLIFVRINGFLLTLLAATALSSLYFSGRGFLPVEYYSAGGISGLLLADFLKQWFNLTGATIVLIMLFFLGFTFLTGISWLRLSDVIGKYVLLICNGFGAVLGSLYQSLYTLLRRHIEEMGTQQQPVNASVTNAQTSNNTIMQTAHQQSASETPTNIQTFSAQTPVDTPHTLDQSAYQQTTPKQQIITEDATPKPSTSVTQAPTHRQVLTLAQSIQQPLRQLISLFTTLKTSHPHSRQQDDEDIPQTRIDPVFDKISATTAQGQKAAKTRSKSSPNTQTDANSSTEDTTTPVKHNQKRKTESPIQPTPISTTETDTTTASTIMKTTEKTASAQSGAPNKASQKSARQTNKYDSLPSLQLLDPPKAPVHVTTTEQLQAMSRLIEEKLADYNMLVEVVAVQQGPVITRYELQLAPGTKVSQLTNLSKDLARALLVVSIRVVEVIAGKSTVGIEIPNPHRQVISFYNVLNSQVYTHGKELLPLALGYDIAGQPVVADLAKMPHLLVAGTTGSGKSVGINAMILSLLFHAKPDQLRLIMVDPKMLELSIYEGIPHLLCPVVTDMNEAANALNWCVEEMERRYKLMAALGVRNIAGYNQKVAQAAARGEPILDPLFEPNPMMASLRPEPLDTLPYIVIVIDEFADMIMIVGKKVEELIARLAQKARAAGLHLIVATQRPSVNVITGLIKANIPTRIAFQVSSKIDSRTILDQMGAETLLGNGDMLFLPPGTGLPQRVHGAFVSDNEVHAVVDDLKQHGSAEYIDGILSGTSNAAGDGTNSTGREQDPLYDQAVAFVLDSQKVSISSIQRRLSVGYNRAARMVEDMEAAGLITPVQANGKREVIAPSS